MKASDLILMAPAIAFAGGLTGLMQHAAYPGDYIYLITSIVLFTIGVGSLAFLAWLIKASLPGTRRRRD